MKNLINDFIEKIANDCVDVYNDCERTQYYPKEKMIKNRIEFVGIVLNNNFENGISLKIEDVCSVLSKKFEHYVSDDNFDINTSDLKINVLPQDETQKIASEIFEKLEENRRQFLLKRNVEFNDYEFEEIDEEKRKEEQKEIVNKILIENFEKSKTIEINKEKMEKSRDFETGIFILNRNLEEYIFNEDENPKNEVEINFSKINGKESYEVNICDYKNKENKVQVKSDNLPNFKEKIVDLLEKNIEIIKRVDENKQKETFQEVKADIVISAMEVNGRRQYLENNGDDYITRFLKGIDECFEDRIGTLKDKEDFITKRHEELGLTLNSNGKISELYSPDESEYKDNINTFFDNIKENIKEEIGNRFNFDLSEEINNINKKLGKEYFENAKENLYANERKKAIDLVKKEYLPIRPQTMSLQKEFLRNAIPILLSEDKMGLTKKEMEELKNISNDKKEELKDRVNNYFNSYSEQAKDTKNDFVFKWNINNFYLSDYDSYSKELDIKIPKGKTVKKEIKKEKSVEMEIEK